jgi:hypothetical protein
MFNLGYLLKLKDNLDLKPKFSPKDGKMFSPNGETRDKIIVPMFKWVIPLIFGRHDFMRRAQVAYKFINRLWVLSAISGSSKMVKQLKADHVALQRAAAGNAMTTLRELEPDLPLWRLTGGYPSIIKHLDPRSFGLVKKGDPRELRWWLTLFGLYRILSCDFKLKLNTITDPFNGSTEGLQTILAAAKWYNPFSALPEVNKNFWPNIYARKAREVRLRKISSAGASTNPS